MTRTVLAVFHKCDWTRGRSPGLVTAMSTSFSAFTTRSQREYTFTSPVSLVRSSAGLRCRWGDLRLRLPVASDPYAGEYNVTEFGLACLQLDISEPVPDILDPQAQALLAADNNNPITQVSEDCEFSVCVAYDRHTNNLSHRPNGQCFQTVQRSGRQEVTSCNCK